MKRFLSLILVLSIISMILTGCVFSRTSIEEDFAGMEIGGVFYTSLLRGETKAERSCLSQRKEGVGYFHSSVEKTASSSFKLITSLEKYEGTILKYMDKTGDLSDAERIEINDMAETMTLYKTVLDSGETELRSYMKMKPRAKASEALILTYMTDTLCVLISSLDDYLNELSSAADRLYSILQSDNQKQAARFSESINSTLIDKIDPARIEMMHSFEKAALMYSYLISGDYLLGIYNLDKAESNIQSLLADGPAGADEDELIGLGQYIQNRRNDSKEPDVMKDIPTDLSTESFSILHHVDAMDPDLATITSAVVPLYKMIKEIYKDKQPATAPSVPAYNESEAPLKPHKIIPSNDAANLAADSTDAVTGRDAAVAKIKLGQNAVSFLGFLSSTDDKYNMIVAQITNMISTGRNNLSDEKRQAAVELIKSNINELIGDNRESFVNKITNESAEKIYDTFMDWKKDIGSLKTHDFTIDDLRNLLNGFGIEVSIPDEKTSSSEDEDNENPSGSVSNGTPSSDDYAYPGIIIPYEEMKAIDQSTSTNEILALILGWNDPVDYSSLEKKEFLDDNGNVEHEYYVQENSIPLGWDITYRTDADFYEYRFPEGMNRSMRIIRDTSTGSDLFISAQITDTDLERVVSFAFNMPGEQKKISFISESTNGIKDGLQASQHSAGATFSYWEDGNQMSSYVYDGETMLQFKQWEYDGNTVYEDTWTYYDNGNPKMEQHLVNGQYDGIYLLYYEDGTLQKSIEYENGLNSGRYEEYYESGRLRRLRIYVDGELSGDYRKYYDNETHQLMESGSYASDMKNGLWAEYDEDGTPESEKEYLNDVLDGVYKDFGRSYGTYRNGEKHGDWYYGKTEDDWTNREYYENDIRIWSQSRNSDSRTYFNPDGSVNRIEKIGD